MRKLSFSNYSRKRCLLPKFQTKTNHNLELQNSYRSTGGPKQYIEKKGQVVRQNFQKETRLESSGKL